MGDSMKWAYEQEQDEIRRNQQRRANEIRAELLKDWHTWSLDKMEMVKIIADLKYGDEEKTLNLLNNRESLETFFRMTRAIAAGRL